MAGAAFTDFYVRGRLIIADDVIETAKNIIGNGQLFRIGAAVDLVTLAADVALIVALYVVLKPINRSLVLLAIFWRLVDCSVAAAGVAVGLAVRFALTRDNASRLLSADQLQILVRWFLSLDTGANRVAALFFGLGSMVFCYLWFRSRYIPRAIAALGILASIVPTVVPFLTLLTPSLEAVHLRRAPSGGPILIFDFIIGLWLVITGIRAPAVKDT